MYTANVREYCDRCLYFVVPHHKSCASLKVMPTKGIRRVGATHVSLTPQTLRPRCHRLFICSDAVPVQRGHLRVSVVEENGGEGVVVNGFYQGDVTFFP